MQALHNSLSEKDRRRYAAVEAEKLGHGGISYIASLFNCDEKTVSKGINELNDADYMSQATIRSAGGGRQSKLEQIENIDTIFLQVLQDYTAGDPMKEDIKWTNLSKNEIKEKLAKKGIIVSRNIIKKLLIKHKFVKRKMQKKIHRKTQRSE